MHSEFSHDSRLPLQEIVDKGRAGGFIKLGVTDHINLNNEKFLGILKKSSENVLAMKILDAFGVGGAFSEFYALDFDDDVVLLGHDGPCHPKIANGKTKIKPLEVYHGKVGAGLSVETSVQAGPATLLSVVDAPDGNVKLLVAEGVSEAGPILEIGNANSRDRFSTGAREFVDAWSRRGPAHHCAIGVGHIADRLEILARILKVDFIRVC